MDFSFRVFTACREVVVEFQNPGPGNPGPTNSAIRVCEFGFAENLGLCLPQFQFIRIWYLIFWFNLGNSFLRLQLPGPAQSVRDSMAKG